MPPRIKKLALNVFIQNLQKLIPPKVGFRMIYGALGGQLIRYNMQGAQAATSIVRGIQQPFKTNLNKHSEMVALEYMLQTNQWIVRDGMVVIPQPGGAQPINVLPGDFTTTQPHCGFCTIALSLMHLPLSCPTKGNYNYAVNLNYPLPAQLITDPNIVARYWDRTSIQMGTPTGVVLKRLLNVMMNNDSTKWVLGFNLRDEPIYFDDDSQVDDPEDKAIFDWSTISHEGYLGEIWRRIWQCLYDVNRE